jgi:perosamine synthetase
VIYCGQPDIGVAEESAVLEVLRGGQLTRGEFCESFEFQLWELLDQDAHVVSSGTAALHLALLAVGVGPGDEVIVPATSFVATINAVLYCGAKPVIVDIDRDSWTINYTNAVAAVTDRTKAIIPVHLYGTPAASFESWSLGHYARAGHRVWIVEDAAESLGSTRSGLPPTGDVNCYSFYGSKTITAGEGGAVCGGDPFVMRRVKHLAGQGMTSSRYFHDVVGYNYRMTEMQAALGVAQLSRLPEFLAKRRQVFDWYNERLPDSFKRQSVGNDDTHGCWAFAVSKQYGPGGPMDAAKVARVMLEDGIETRPIFPPSYWFRYVDQAASLPHGLCLAAEHLHKHGLVLPTHTSLTENDVEKVCASLVKAASCS